MNTYYISIKMPSRRYTLPKRILSSIFLVLFFLPLHSISLPNPDIKFLNAQKALLYLDTKEGQLQLKKHVDKALQLPLFKQTTIENNDRLADYFGLPYKSPVLTRITPKIRD